MSLRTKSRMPASTSDTASRSVSTSAVSSCSERLIAFIGYFLVFACEASAEVPRTTTLSDAIRAADFDRDKPGPDAKRGAAQRAQNQTQHDKQCDFHGR